MDLSSSSSKSKLVSTFRRRAGSLSRGSLAKNKNKEKDKSHSLTSALRISGPTNYRNNSVTGLFGVPLAAALKEHVEAGFKVPPFIEQVCLHIEQTMLHTQGMFRLAANAEALEKCRNALNDGKTLDLWHMDDLVICDLLKLYLRQLPEPLLTFELYDCFLAKAKAALRMGQPVDLHGLVDLLPTPNQRLLKRIVYTLRKVSQHSAQNKMNEDNLGMIFGPNLLRALAGPDEQLLEDFAHINGITLALIKNYDSLFAKVDYEPHYKCYVRALFDYEPPPHTQGELRVRQGDVLMVVEIHGSGWWLGELSYGGGGRSPPESAPPDYQGEKIIRQVGYFPATYCAYLSGRECQTHDNEQAWEEGHYPTA